MVLGAHVWTLDWLRLHPDGAQRDRFGVQWILTEEKGFWSSPGTNATLSSRLGKHGAYRSPGWKNQRTITLTGRAYCPNYALLRQAEANVLGLLADPRRPATLTCYSEIGALSCEVFLDGDILCTPLKVISEPGIEFSIQLVAPDPAKYAIDYQEMSTGLPRDAGDGLDFARVMPPDTNQGLFFGMGADDDGLSFGTSNASGFMRLTNTGTAPTMPVFTLYGPLTNPVLTAGQASMRYNAVLAPGEYVVIDPAAPSVLLGGTAVRRHLLNPASFAGFAIPPADPATGKPGELSVGLTHTGPVTDAGSVRARFRSAWF
ncbi:phage tail domain-containing protein [Saccharopolyspora spinosa]|uniref:Tail protein n=1 Tax=Saccharopolyspora spinosa TaxID=60894 RepID=A0A2N3XZ79_SACSN|nr:phage tail domain-containing protein [Saccharopolyspora spinosa]PKW15920.1 tail protein [Saccharopolyspora spinosa]